MRITKHTNGNVDGIEMLRFMAPADGHTRPTRDERIELDQKRLEDERALTGRKKVLDSDCPWGRER